MPQSTLKKILLEQDDKSIKKRLVSIDINSWNETEQKKKTRSNKPIRSIHLSKKLAFSTKKSKPKQISNYHTQQKIKQISLKQEITKDKPNYVIKSQNHYQIQTKQNCQDIRTKSKNKSQSDSNSSRNYRNYCDQFMKLPLVDVNQLAIQQNIKETCYGSRNRKPEIRLKPKNSTIPTQIVSKVIPSRKSSLCRRQKQVKLKLKNIIQSWKIQTHSNAIREIINEKGSKNPTHALMGDGVVLCRKNLAGLTSYGSKGKIAY